MQWVARGMELAVLIALALGATMMLWLLEASSTITNWIGGLFKRRPDPFAGLALFFFLLVGVPILMVAWGFATGALPVRH